VLATGVSPWTPGQHRGEPPQGATDDMGHTVSKHLYHVVFSTKGREPWLAASARPRLFDYMVNDQPAHHRQRDFGAQLARLLSRHGVEFDPDHYLD